MITYRKGDITTITDHNSIVAHVCNNVGAYGAGVALCIRNKWPSAYWTYKRSNYYYMGLNSYAKVNKSKNIFVANMVAQYGIKKSPGALPLMYPYLEQCLNSLLNCKEQFSFHMPKIGTGLAGGDWAIIEPMIDAIFVDRNVYVWEL